MHLTREEERMYDGEQGWAYQTALRILVRLGDLFGATRLVPIESAHISGVSYKTIGDAPIEFLEALVEDGARSKVLSTVNPGGLDYEHLTDVAVPPEVREKQLKIVSLYEKIGIEPALTCTPYYVRKPRRGAHLAWAESSAVIYANSLLGSWTNREGGPSALAAALIGKTPDYGMHERENRQANVQVKVESELTNEAEFGALGIHLGKLLKDMVPVFDGLPDHEEVDLKQLGAALASSGMTSIFHPCSSCHERVVGLESLVVERSELEEAYQSLSTTSDSPDLVFVGCPHCSLEELRRVAELINGEKLARDVMFWACASRHVREKAEKYVRAIEQAGGRVVCDTCAVVTWVKELGVDTLMTNSAKTAYYAPTLNKVKVRLAPLTECISAACRQ